MRGYSRLQLQMTLENSEFSLNQTASLLLAAAVCDLFPHVLMVQGQGGKNYFHYDFVFPFEFQEHFLALIEERMRLLIREKRPVGTMEMMPTNAASLMEHQGQSLIAERLHQLDRTLIQMGKVGDFVTVSEAPILEDLNLPFFKILEGFSLPIAGKKIIRIVGIASHDKQTLKTLVKQPARSEMSHLSLVKQMRLLEPLEEGMWLWLPRGEKVRELLIQWWRQEHLKQNFSLVSSPASMIGERGEQDLRKIHKDYFLLSGEPNIAEMAWLPSSEESDPAQGLFTPAVSYADRCHLFCSEEKLLQECISSLQFILKIPKILDFEFEIILSVSNVGTKQASLKKAQMFQQALEKLGVAYTVKKDYRVGILASVDVCLTDSLGRTWVGPFLSLPEATMPGTGNVLIRSAFGSLERLMALLLENKGGKLPLWLAPEQVRILIVNHKADQYTKEVLQTLKTQGIRVTVEGSEKPLKTRLYRAILEKVPYVVLLGEREEQAKTLTVRFNADTEEQNLTLEEFWMRLKVEIGSVNSELTN
jgi:threonyl-tRNA synthetase